MREEALAKRQDEESEKEEKEEMVDENVGADVEEKEGGG